MINKNLENKELSKTEAIKSIENSHGFLLTYINDKGEVEAVGSLSEIQDVEKIGLLAYTEKLVKIVMDDVI